MKQYTLNVEDRVNMAIGIIILIFALMLSAEIYRC